MSPASLQQPRREPALVPRSLSVSALQKLRRIGALKKVIITGGATVCTQPESKAQVIYTITSKGMEVDLQFYPDASLPEIPEVSVLFELPKDFENLTYLGNY